MSYEEDYTCQDHLKHETRPEEPQGKRLHWRQEFLIPMSARG